MRRASKKRPAKMWSTRDVGPDVMAGIHHLMVSSAPDGQVRAVMIAAGIPAEIADPLMLLRERAHWRGKSERMAAFVSRSAYLSDAEFRDALNEACDPEGRHR